MLCTLGLGLLCFVVLWVLVLLFLILFGLNVLGSFVERWWFLNCLIPGLSGFLTFGFLGLLVCWFLLSVVLVDYVV